VKEDQHKLDEEILALRMQNLTLQSKLEKLQMSQAYPQLGDVVDSRKAMVVFDLTRNPPIVLTTNDTFCKLLGYEMVFFCLFCLFVIFPTSLFLVVFVIICLI
jgi:hypothetical protein